MFRKDVRYMTHLEWEPKVPSAEVIKSQFARKPNIAGSVHAALGQIIGDDSGAMSFKVRRKESK